MAKGIAHHDSKTGIRTMLNAFSVGLLLSLLSCSKAIPPNQIKPSFSNAETFPISNSEFINCHFKDPNPTYSFGQSIPPNPIQCDQGVPRSVQILNPNALPTGLQFSMNQLSLIGTPSEKITGAPYQFYLENESGYVILKMQLSVK